MVHPGAFLGGPAQHRVRGGGELVLGSEVEIWEAELEHACTEHLRYANAGSQRATFAYKATSWTGVRKALAATAPTPQTAYD